MKKFKPSAVSLALMLGGLTLASMPSYAAEEEKEEQQAEAGADVEVIEVRGFRRSLIESINKKRYSDTVVEAVSADDLGALPDVSIADALSRLPGVTSVRQGGQSSELNIRGLSGNYVFATLNGREVVSNEGGRSVQFDQYPSELINSAQVYKSQKASLIEGGVAGTIELQTANPLNNDQDHTFNISGKLSYNDSESAEPHPEVKSEGHRFSFSYQGKFLDETLGMGIGYSRLNQPKIHTTFTNYAPNFRKIPFDNAPGLCLGKGEDQVCGNYAYPNGFEIMARGGDDTRDGLVGTITFEPNDEWSFKLDTFYSKFDSESYDRGQRLGGIGLDNPVLEFSDQVLLADSPIIIGGTYAGDPDGEILNYPNFGGQAPFYFETQSDTSTVESEVFTIGGNVKWMKDDWTLSADFSHSKGDSISLDGVMRLHLFDDASADMPVATDDITVRYELNGLVMPTIDFDSATTAGLTGPSRMMVTALEKYPNREENEASSFKLDFQYELENDFFSSVETGFRWSERSHDFDRKMYFLGDHSSQHTNRRNGDYVITWDTSDPNNPVPAEIIKPYQLSEGEYEVVQLGGTFGDVPAFLAIDNDAIEEAWYHAQGYDTTAVKSFKSAWTYNESVVVDEEILAFYLQANISTEIFDLPLSGNFGVRVVETEQSSTGLRKSSEDDPNASCITDGFGVTECVWMEVTDGITYTDVLPSINLNLELTENDQLRFAAAEVMARPEMDQMRMSGTWTTRNEPSGAFVDLSDSTNPRRKPFYATQYDLSYEHYFSETDGAFVAAIFYKDIKAFTTEETFDNFDFAGAGIVVPAADDGGAPPTPGNYSTTISSDDAGYLKGYEIAYTQTFSFLPEPFSGLGISGNYSYTDSEITTSLSLGTTVESTTGPLKGLSKEVWTVALYYDYEDFSTRINARYRDDYIGEQVEAGAKTNIYFNEETIIDYQASYQVTEEVQVIFSVNNLTDEPNISYFGHKALTGTIQEFGRQYYLGFNSKF